MNILFLTLVNIKYFGEKHNIYADLCRELAKGGNTVHIVCPIENKRDAETHFEQYGKNCGILKVRTGRIQKTNLIRKGIETLLVGTRYKKAIKKHLRGTRYDLVVYSTPPITLGNIVKYIMKRDGATTYLLLKDIFPQNAVDLGMMTESGIKSVIYKYFRKKEKELYAVSNSIGCMSPRNAEYLLAHNPYIPAEKVHVSPNSFEPTVEKMSCEEKLSKREKYGLPKGKKIFVYGGNLGKPQGVPFIVECMKRLVACDGAYFVICGGGTEYSVIEKYVSESGQKNLKLIAGLPRDEYEEFVGCCDVGLIFLDHRFTIPNFPSRLLSYMQKSMPVISCTDVSTDIGLIAEQGGFGWNCRSNDVSSFVMAVDSALSSDTEEMGERAAKYMIEHYSVKKSAEIILGEYEKVKK